MQRWFGIRCVQGLLPVELRIAPNCLSLVEPGRKRCWSRRWLWKWTVVFWLQILFMRAPGHDRRLAPEAEPTAAAVPARRARRVLQRARCFHLRVVVRPEYVRDQRNGYELAVNAGYTRRVRERFPTGFRFHSSRLGLSTPADGIDPPSRKTGARVSMNA